MSEKEDLPADPLTELAKTAAQIHELYVSFVESGFTPAEALYLIGQMISNAGKS